MFVTCNGKLMSKIFMRSGWISWIFMRSWIWSIVYYLHQVWHCYLSYSLSYFTPISNLTSPSSHSSMTLLFSSGSFTVQLYIGFNFRQIFPYIQLNSHCKRIKISSSNCKASFMVVLYIQYIIHEVMHCISHFIFFFLYYLKMNK